MLTFCLAPTGILGTLQVGKLWELPLIAGITGGERASLAGIGICWRGVGNLNVPEAKLHFSVTVWHHAGKRDTQVGNGGTQAGKISAQPQVPGCQEPAKSLSLPWSWK